MIRGRGQHLGVPQILQGLELDVDPDPWRDGLRPRPRETGSEGCEERVQPALGRRHVRVASQLRVLVAVLGARLPGGIPGAMACILVAGFRTPGILAFLALGGLLSVLALRDVLAVLALRGTLRAFARAMPRIKVNEILPAFLGRAATSAAIGDGTGIGAAVGAGIDAGPVRSRGIRTEQRVGLHLAAFYCLGVHRRAVGVRGTRPGGPGGLAGLGPRVVRLPHQRAQLLGLLPRRAQVVATDR
ncbi:hypothetical protein AFL94_07930 [Arthrobacter sp. LS16]|nr:hypothetical protein AFL94_07930 [Arthrobacter sp. LS16]